MTKTVDLQENQEYSKSILIEKEEAPA